MIHKDTKERRKLKSKKIYKGTSETPRLRVFRSNKHVYVQAIDDVNNVVILQSSTLEKDVITKISKKNKVEQAFIVGEILGKKLNDKKIKKAIFDRSYYKYHGRVKSVAEGIRKSNIIL